MGADDRPDIVDNNVLNLEFFADLLGGMKIAYLMGGVREEKLHAGLHVSAMNLQKLFVKLTEKEVSSHEA